MRGLVDSGHVEPRVKVVQVKETRGTGFLDCPAHVLTATTYHATESGINAWVSQKF